MDQLVRECVETPDEWVLTPVDDALVAAMSRANRIRLGRHQVFAQLFVLPHSHPIACIIYHRDYPV
jgi:hypothetical protein